MAGYNDYNTRGKVREYVTQEGKILRGETQDDFTNHFFSHFGFMDIAPDQDAAFNRSRLNSVPDPKIMPLSKGLR